MIKERKIDDLQLATLAVKVVGSGSSGEQKFWFIMAPSGIG